MGIHNTFFEYRTPTALYTERERNITSEMK